MINIFDIIAVAIVAIAISLLIFDNVRSRARYRELGNLLIQSELDKMAISDALDKTIKENEIIQSDGFIKFLSESRDAAFEYIEQAQKDVSEFVEKADSVFESYPNKDIRTSYQKIKGLLPNKSQS